MVNDHPRGIRAPSTTAAALTAGHHTPVDHPPATSARLDGALYRRLAFAQAQGVLTQITGCTPARAGEVLLQVGAQLGFDSADGVAEFFLTCAAADPVGHDTVAFTRRATSATLEIPALQNGNTEGVTRRGEAASEGFATLIAGGRGVVVRGELDIATAPLLRAAVVAHLAAATPGHLTLLDLHDMTFIDVRGLRALSEIYTEVGALGDHLRVGPPSDPFTRWTLQFAIRAGWLPPMFAGGAPWFR